MTKKLLGFVGVDSGQLMICDPCYIDSEWEKKEFEHITILQDKKTKKKYQFLSKRNSALKIKGAEIFPNYIAKLKNGLTMNEMLEKEMVENIEVPKKLIGDFSYAGVCETTLSKNHQLKYKMGHDGVGIAFNSGYGDGCYKVYGHFNAEGRCMKVEILMD
jgi:hypothetical protein